MFGFLTQKRKTRLPLKQKFDVDAILSSHKAFNDFVYTPVHQAIAELKQRAENKYLDGQIAELLNHDIPPFLESGRPKAVLFRQISTPNHEIRRFFSIIDALEKLDPLVGEHQEDRFASVNEYKYSLGKLLFNRRKTDDEQFESLKIIETQMWEGKRLCDIETVWKQNLLEFHHELFGATYRAVNPFIFHNISPWLAAHGGNARNYYKPVMAWFLKHGILFENFLVDDGKEHTFTREIFLPAFIDVYEKTGFKPLIVNLLPTTIEGRKFWLCHPIDAKKYVEDKLESARATIPKKP